MADDQLSSNPMVQLLRDWLKGCPNPPEWHWTFDLHVRTVNLLGNIPTADETSGQLRASEWAEVNNAAVTKEWMSGWDACLVANRIPLTTGSLLRPASTQAPPGCHCQMHCAAPVVMGRQTPCRDPEKASVFARAALNGSDQHKVTK